MHIPVLLQEVIEYLEPATGKKYIDATVGMAGHAMEIVKRGGMVLGIDPDPSAIHNSSSPPLTLRGGTPSLKVREGRGELLLVQGNFKDIKEIAEEHGFTEVDGILFDLGMGSYQLDDPGRGFSFQKEGPLDMRYNPSSPRPLLPGRRGRKGEEALTAADIVNKYPEKDLIRIFYQYGEEWRFGKRIARSIVENRKIKPYQTTAELFETIRRPDAARRIFQALRIEVNQELVNLEKALPQAVELLKKPVIASKREAIPRDRRGLRPRDDSYSGGRLVVISFHSLEDRIVKNFMREKARDCVCPPEFPECRCDAKASLRVLTKKPITASREEMLANPRSKSAKLRAAEKIKN